MSKSRWSTYGIIYKHNPTMDKRVREVMGKMSMSYSLIGKSTTIRTCDELTEVVMFSLYNLKKWKETGKNFSYGLIEDDVDLHLKNLSNDVQMMKMYNVWSHRVENIVNEHHRKKEEQEQRILSLPKQEQEYVRQVQMENLIKEMEIIMGV